MGGVATGLLGKSHVLPRSVYPFNVWAEADSGSAAKLAAKADGFFKRVKDMPFYLQVGSAFPHRKGGARFPAEFGGEEFGDTRYEPDEVPVPAWLPDVPEVRADLAEYYGYVERWDRTVGAMLEALEASGRAGETMVIVMTDHGMPFPAAKGSSFEAGHHCPLLIRVPGGEGVRKEAMVSWLDIAPTVYEWLGVDPLNTPGDAGGEVPRESWEVMPGRSLLPILSQGDPEGWDEVYYAHNFHEVANYYPYRVVRGRRYKYVRNLAWELPMPIPGDLYLSPTWGAVRERGLTMMGERAVERVLHHDREALFDLESDPLELHNRIEDAALADVAEGMRERLTSMRIGTRDPWLRQSFQEGEVTAEQREEAGV